MEVNPTRLTQRFWSEKQAIVADLTEKLKTAASGVLVDYKGITVAEDTALRAECRKNELDYAVVKNTLVRFRHQQRGSGGDGFRSEWYHFSGPEPWDPIAPMRVIAKFAKQFNGEKFTIKAGFMDGKVVSDEIKALSDLPSKRSPAGSGSGHHAGSHLSPAWLSSPRRSPRRRAASSRLLPPRRLPPPSKVGTSVPA